MKYINATVEAFSEFVKKTNKKIILFGAGTVCRTFVPYITELHGLTAHIIYVVDNNTTKQGGSIKFGDYNVPVVSVEIFNSCREDYCILITNGDFYSVVQQLQQTAIRDDICCFIAAYMQLDRLYEKEANHVYKDCVEARIPKIIHYCWFSGNPMPENLKRCIETWKEECPDYEIICWNEDNFDLNKYRYTSEAARQGKWGFIPDIVRLEKLYEIGGFYFDTDVEILKNLDELRYQEAFCGRERAGHINFGGGSGCVKGNPIVKEILDFRKDEEFGMEASGYYETTPLMKRGLEIEDTNQKIDGINIYASEFFSPYNYINGDDIRNDNTFSIHYFSCSWIEGGNILRQQTREKYIDFKRGLEEVPRYGNKK
jgi:mannosyltransferase OCH1-like enzyme